jgi:hypothetical protein
MSGALGGIPGMRPGGLRPQRRFVLLRTRRWHVFCSLLPERRSRLQDRLQSQDYGG